MTQSGVIHIHMSTDWRCTTFNPYFSCEMWCNFSHLLQGLSGKSIMLRLMTLLSLCCKRIYINDNKTATYHYPDVRINLGG